MEALLGLAGVAVFLVWFVAPWVALSRGAAARESAKRSRELLEKLERQLQRTQGELQAARQLLAERAAGAPQPAADPAREAALEALAVSAAEAVAPITRPPEPAREAVIEAIPAPERPRAPRLVHQPRPPRKEKARHGHGRDAPGDEAALRARAEDEAARAGGGRPASGEEKAVPPTWESVRPPEEARADAAAAFGGAVEDAAAPEKAAQLERLEQARAAAAARAAERRARRAKQWNESVKPFIAENVVWFLGGFLVIAGSLYFIRLAWGASGEVGRHLLLVAVALAYSAAFVGVGLWFKRKHNLVTPSRAMAYVGLSLLPVALLNAADAFAAGRIAWALALPIAVAAAWPIAWLASGLLARELARPLAWAYAGMLGMLGLARAAAAVSPLAALALPYAAWLVAHRAAAEPLRGAQAPPTAALAFHFSALGYALAFHIGLSRAVAGDVPGLPWLSAMGPLAVLVSFSALRLDVELRARWGARPHLDPALVAAFCLGMAGVAGAARVAPLLALSAALAAALFAVSLVWFRRQLLLGFALAMAGVAWGALLFGEGPVEPLLRAWGRLLDAALGPFGFDRLPAWAFLLLPLAAAAHWIGQRMERRDEPRLGQAGRRFGWAVLLGAVAVSLTTGDLRSSSPALLLAAPLVAWWHLQRPRARTAWAGALALGAGTMFAAAIRSDFPLPAAAAVLGLCGLAAALRTGKRLGAAALLQAASLWALGALAAALLGSGAQPAPHAWLPALALAAAIWTAAALTHASALFGLLAVAAAGLILWTGLFGAGAAGFAFLLAPFGPLELRALALPAALAALAVAGRLAARRVRGQAGLPLVHRPLRPRARGLHALSEAALALAWPALLAVAAAALGEPGPAGPLALFASALLAALLGRLARLEAGAALSTASLAAAGALAADLLLREAAGGRTLGALALGGAAGAGLAALLWARLPARKRLAPVHAFGREVGAAGLFLASLAGLVACAPLLAPLSGSLPPPLALLPATRLGGLIAAAAAALPAVAWYLLQRRSEGALAVPLIASTAALAALVASSLGLLWVAAALAALAAAAAAAHLVLQQRLEAAPPAGPESGAEAFAAATARGPRKLGKSARAADRVRTLRIFSAACAALGACASFLPPGAPFPIWPHAAADGLLLAFLGLALAAGRGPLFLHLLFVALGLTATRVRMALGIPTQGHGMVLAAGGLLALGVLLRRKERYAVVALGWALLAAVAAWLRFSVTPSPPGPRLDQWTWALGAALVAVPLAPRLLPAFTSTFAAAGAAAALLLGALAAWQPWMTGPAQGWTLCCAVLGLAWALLAFPVERGRGLAASFLAPEELARALRQAGALLVAAPATLALLAAGAALLRFPVDGAPPAGQVALLLAICAAGTAALLFRTDQPIDRATDPLGGGLAIAAALLVSDRLSARFPAAPVLVLTGFALAARALRRIPFFAPRAELAALASWLLALISSHLSPREWTTAAVVAALALLAPQELLPKLVRALAPRTWVLLGAAAFALSFWASVSPLGAALGVLAPLGLLAAAAAWAHTLRGSAGPGAPALALAAAGLALLAAFTSPMTAAALAVLATGALLVALAAFLAVRGQGSLLDLALLGGVLLHAFWRAAPLPELFARSADPALALFAALLLVGGERALRRSRDDLADSLLRGSAALPALAVALALVRGGAGPLARIAFFAAVVYGLLWWLHRLAAPARLAALGAVALCNLALFATWADRGVSDVQLYTIPLGLSLLVAAQLGRGDLRPGGLQLLRGLGCVVLYAGTGWQMAGSDGLLFPLLLGLLALCTVGAGALLRVRAFLFLGAATVVVDVLANLVRYGTRSTPVLALTATATGLSIIAGMAWFSIRREQALALYRRFATALEDWE